MFHYASQHLKFNYLKKKKIKKAKAINSLTITVYFQLEKAFCFTIKKTSCANPREADLRHDDNVAIAIICGNVHQWQLSSQTYCSAHFFTRI